jgi:hypothetical protein
MCVGTGMWRRSTASFPGILVILLNIAAGVFFVYSLKETREAEKEADKRFFYTTLGTRGGWCVNGTRKATLAEFYCAMRSCMSVVFLCGCCHCHCCCCCCCCCCVDVNNSGFGYSWWFASLAVVVTIATALSPWVRERIVTTITLTVDACGYAGTCFTHRH